MGLDMYLNAEKRLNPKRKRDKQYIDYFNTLPRELFEDDDGDGSYLYVSEYFSNSKDVHAHLKTMPKLYGQVGDIKIIKPDGDSYIISTEAAYWRKANQIHNWFVEKCQDGVDDCGTYPISFDQLKTLYNTMGSFGKLPSEKSFRDGAFQPTPEQVELAETALPSVGGFFFGSTDYDVYYFWDIKDTRKQLKDLMNPATINNWKLTYNSSW